MVDEKPKIRRFHLSELQQYVSLVEATAYNFELMDLLSNMPKLLSKGESAVDLTFNSNGTWSVALWDQPGNSAENLSENSPDALSALNHAFYKVFAKPKEKDFLQDLGPNPFHAQFIKLLQKKFKKMSDKTANLLLESSLEDGSYAVTLEWLRTELNEPSVPAIFDYRDDEEDFVGPDGEQ